MRLLNATTAAVALLVSGGAFASPPTTPLTGLYNTGAIVNSNGTDANYTVTTNNLPAAPSSLSASNGFGTTQGGSSSSGNLNLSGSHAYVAPANNTYIQLSGSANGATGQWIPSGNNPVGSTPSSWITPLTPSDISLDPSVNGEYMYQTTFTISNSQNLLTAQLSGAWAADNFGYATLNGHVIASINDPRDVSLADGAGYDQWNTIASVANSYFVTGTNTLDFFVYNIGQSSGNPTGLRAEFNSSISSISAVPEPTESMLVLSGLGLLGFIAARRKSV